MTYESRSSAGPKAGDAGPVAVGPTGSTAFVIEITALRAEVARLREAIEWVLKDACYKAPEQVDAELSSRWMVRLAAALTRPETEPSAPGSPELSPLTPERG